MSPPARDKQATSEHPSAYSTPCSSRYWTQQGSNPDTAGGYLVQATKALPLHSLAYTVDSSSCAQDARNERAAVGEETYRMHSLLAAEKKSITSGQYTSRAKCYDVQFYIYSQYVGFAEGCVCNLTLTVSKGWPTKTTTVPPAQELVESCTASHRTQVLRSYRHTYPSSYISS